jgi:hypothetical protein
VNWPIIQQHSSKRGPLDITDLGWLIFHKFLVSRFIHQSFHARWVLDFHFVHPPWKKATKSQTLSRFSTALHLTTHWHSTTRSAGKPNLCSPTNLISFFLFFYPRSFLSAECNVWNGQWIVLKAWQTGNQCHSFSKHTCENNNYNVCFRNRVASPDVNWE